MDTLKGHLLISSGGLFDASFRHTVVLVGAHDALGAVGVILNRAREVTVAQAIPLLAELTGAREALFEGGPVAPREAVLLVEATDPSILDVPVFDGVGFLTGDVPSEVRAAIRRARVFLGHAGWGPGQLDAEVEAGAWIVEPALVQDVFSEEPGALWQRLLERKGPPFATLAKIPFDPSTN